MIHSLGGEHMGGSMPPSYTQDNLLADLSNQMLASQASRRHSRGSNGQRAGSAMRVVKPGSTSNSPRSSLILNRRRTLMSEAQTPRRPQATDYLQAVPNHDVAQPIGRPPRPVSWHPGSEAQQYPREQLHINYPFSTPSMYADQPVPYLSQPFPSPMMSYSNNTSPASTFSPLPGTSTSTQLMSGEGYDLAQRPTQYFHNAGLGKYSESVSTPNTTADDTGRSGYAVDWNSFVLNGYNNTTPPTPESFPQIPDVRPTVPQESMSYQELEEAEDEGEILVGMGLYDTPEKSNEDPQLNNYRSTVTSLLGSKFASQEPTGRGLKLEETWEPPNSEDGDEDNDEENEEDDTEE